MKNYFYIIITLLLFMLISCDGLMKSEKQSKKIKDGIVKQYRAGNILKTEIMYKNGKRHGVSKNYYGDGKTLHQKIEYKEDKKHGEAITYYENGNIYQSTPYIEDKIEGVRKKYRQNGKLMSEAPYKNDHPCQGLKEYLLDGSLKKKFPKIVFKPKDDILKNGRYDLEVMMSDKSRNVDFYVNTPLSKDGCLIEEFGSRSNYKPGVLRLSYTLPPNAFIMEELSILAVVKTNLGNQYVTTAKYNLAIENRGF